MVLGLVTSVMLARILQPEQYGHYSYVWNTANLLLLLVSIGHFTSVSMMLAHIHDEGRKRSLLGSSLLVTLVVCGVFCCLVFNLSFFQDHFFRDKIGYPLRLLALPMLLFPLQAYLDSVLVGLNRIHALSIQRAVPKVLYIIALFIYIRLASLNFVSAFILMLFSVYVVQVQQIVRLKPTFQRVRDNLRTIAVENRRYGFHVYIGSLSNVAMTYVCALSIAYFGDDTKLGFFNLASTISGPLGLLPGVIATTFFRSFAAMTRIPFKVLTYTLGLSLCTYAVYVCLLRRFIVLFYSAQYLESVSLGYILGLAVITQGLGDVFNRFLCAKARGKEVRNGAFLAGAVNVIAILFLVRLFHGTGAALTRLVAGGIYCTAMYAYYRRCVAQLKGEHQTI